MPAASARADAPPQSVAEYIEEMLAELAKLAEANGLRKLGGSLRLLAIEAARESPADTL
jgi:hypothetical protein